MRGGFALSFSVCACEARERGRRAHRRRAFRHAKRATTGTSSRALLDEVRSPFSGLVGCNVLQGVFGNAAERGDKRCVSAVVARGPSATTPKHSSVL